MSLRRRARRTWARRSSRVATDLVVRSPALWRVLRPLVQRNFDVLAPEWDRLQSPGGLAPYEAALAAIEGEVRRALDLGTGTGTGAFAIARRFPGAEVVGVDVAAEMVEQAVTKTPSELASRVRFVEADASRLPFAEGSFDLVTHANMIPFFGELARVLAPGGHAVFGFSAGAATPIYVPPERLRRELERRGFSGFRQFAAGRGTAVLAQRHGVPSEV